MKNRLSRKTREQFEDLLDQVYNEGLKDGQVLSSNNLLNELHAVGQVKYVGNPSFGYFDLTTGNTYKILEKTTHLIDNIPVLKILDDKENENDCSLIRPDTAHLFKAVKQPEQIPIAKESPIKNTKYSL